MDQSESPPSFLPNNVDTSNLIDITGIGDSFRRYLNPNTGEIHDGAEYYKRYLELS